MAHASAITLDLSVIINGVTIGESGITITKEHEEYCSFKTSTGEEVQIRVLRKSDTIHKESDRGKTLVRLGSHSNVETGLKAEDELPGQPANYYIKKLQSGPDTLSLPFFDALKSTLQNANFEWLATFVGLGGLDVIEQATSSYDLLVVADATVLSCQSKLAECFAILLNNKVLLQQIISGGKRIVTKFIKLLFTTKNIALKTHLVEMLAAMALFSKPGNALVSRCLEKAERSLGDCQKFRLFVSLMRETPDARFRATCVALVNCLVLAPSVLDVRLRVRSYFIQAGLLPAFEEIGKQNDEEDNFEGLTTQLKVFKEKMDDDEIEEQELLSNLPLAVDNPIVLFKEVATHVEYERGIISLLKYLLMIPYDQKSLADIIWEYLLKAAHHVVYIKDIPEEEHEEFERDAFYTILLKDLANNIARSRESKKVPEAPITATFPTPPTMQTPAAYAIAPPPPPAGPKKQANAYPPPAPPPGMHSPLILHSPPGIPHSPGKIQARKMPPPAPAPPPPPLFTMKLKPVATLQDAKLMLDANTKELENLVAAAIGKPKKATIKPAGHFALKAPIVHIVDPRKANNIAAELAKIKGIPHNQIAQAILLAKEEVLSTEQLEILVKLIPTADEIEALNSLTGDKNTLSVAEKYFLEVASVPRLKQKIKALILKNQFNGRIEKLTNVFTTVKQAAMQLSDATNLLKLLEGIAAVGTYLSAGIKQQKPYDFKLDTLKKPVIHSGHKVTALHYVIETTEQVDKSVLTFSANQINAVPKAATLSLQSLVSDLEELTNEVKNLVKELENTDPESAEFREALKSFSLSSQLETENAALLLKETDKEVQKMFHFFGADVKKAEDPKATQDFFKLIVGFTTQFESAMREVQKEKAAAKTAKPAPQHFHVKSPPLLHPLINPLGQIGVGGGVLDNLFDSIKIGNFALKK
eukprot:Phypoly_transcript_02109.p1 GENE.Phypoly_transcript_02109~~Phypoly_transcript_02109.p1  ORF type:complete len:929 (+),score=183.79 Phypoly_transcript_02109:168-2954(+)